VGLHSYLSARRWFGGALFRNAGFVDFLTIYNGFTGRGDSEAHSVAPDGNDGKAGIAVDDDYLTDFAREHKHNFPPCAEKNR
jgi:hypothetical protein